MKTKNATLPLGVSLPISVWVWVSTILLSILFFTIGLLVVLPVSLFFNPGSRRLQHFVAVLWAKMAIMTNPLWKLRVQGAKHVKPGKHYLIIANHQSLLDILVVLAGLPWHLHFKFLAKKELFPIPFFGWQMTLAGYIPIDRSSPESRKRIMGIARDWLRRKVSVLFYPEGTRSLDGEIHAFKTGAFKLAQEENVEILPVVIEGTRDALPKKSWRMEKLSPLLLSIGEPVSVNQKPQERIEKARDQIREEMIRRLAHIRGLIKG